MAIVKYIRVSTRNQNTARQETDQDKYDKVYIDYASGKDTERPQLKAMLDWVRSGDTVVVDSYERLSRDRDDLMNIVQRLNDMGVKVISQKEPIDITTPQGKMMLSFIAGIAQYEREVSLQRQAEGIAIAKAEGRMGRPSIKLGEEFRAIVADWRAGKTTATKAIELAGTSKATFYRKVKELGL